MKKILHLLLFLVIFVCFVQPAICDDRVDDIRTRIQKAKTNLIIGNFNEAFLELKSLKAETENDQYKIPEIKAVRTDILYNLALAYDQKYVLDTEKSLDSGNYGDLFLADDLFKESSPEIWEDVITIEEEGGKQVPKLRAVGGIVGTVIKSKVKDWLKNSQNCSCRFSGTELDQAGNIFILLTEKEDIAHLKDINTRQKKIQEIFSRIKNYINNLKASSPIKELYDKKIASGCKI